MTGKLKKIWREPHLLTPQNSSLTMGKMSLTSPIVINVPTRALLAIETKGSFVQEVGAFE